MFNRFLMEILWIGFKLSYILLQLKFAVFVFDCHISFRVYSANVYFGYMFEVVT
jgi:hypothetical protein